MSDKIFQDFVLENQVPQETADKFAGKIPAELAAIWQQYGFGTLLTGYLKIINPDQFQDVLHTSYFRSRVAIPILATAMGDLITWEENRYVRLVNYRKGKFQGISAGFEFFFSDLEDPQFLTKDLDAAPFLEAVREYGAPKYDECFGYVPLLALGGAEKVENLKKVQLLEHLRLITELVGPIE
ncbi:T6SS immunity protein Tdi1 domain-containing protein [Tumebacillus flagellatus]|uniref:DUF1851 domain-containing protein n=1 Tax=Tumebacillus flagellatus TaxID=1157490 RepID=A0A074LMU0_9BACL|nr:T6SS immunity protein Tdi1 domain-containing protein [Tumebacillus flagellatus]KEO81840.1 hypothetical protein EL26_18545 [Tumebacillus flagellatus]